MKVNADKVSSSISDVKQADEMNKRFKRVRRVIVNNGRGQLKPLLMELNRQPTHLLRHETLINKDIC